jgi:hypothetical protein
LVKLRPDDATWADVDKPFADLAEIEAVRVQGRMKPLAHTRLLVSGPKSDGRPHRPVAVELTRLYNRSLIRSATRQLSGRRLLAGFRSFMYSAIQVARLHFVRIQRRLRHLSTKVKLIMRDLVSGYFVACLLLGTPQLVGGDDATASALIEKAVKATYGGANSAKNHAVYWKAKFDPRTLSAFNGPRIGEHTITRSYEPTKVDDQPDLDEGEPTIVIPCFVNEVMSGNRDAFKERPGPEGLYAGRISALRGLEDGQIKLSMLPALKIGGQSLAGVKVSSPGHKDISLWFDNKGLLAKSMGRVKDTMSGADVNQETSFSDYRDVRGVQRFHRMLIRRGKESVDVEVTYPTAHQ